MSLFSFVVFVAAGIIIASLVVRYKRRELEHRERMTVLAEGERLPALESASIDGNRWLPRTYLLRGLMWLFSGVGRTIFLIGISLSSHREYAATFRVDDAVRAKANGATDEQVRAIMKDRRESSVLPLGVSLIGLIPIGVGMAYLLTYRTELRLGERL